MLYGYRQLLKAKDIYKNIAEDIETKFGTSNFELGRPLPNGRKKKVIGLMKDELGENIMKEFVGLRVETYSYLKDNNNKERKAKYTKSYSIKKNLNLRFIKIV